VRELKNVLERAAILQHGRELRPSELLGRITMPVAASGEQGNPGNPGEILTMEEVERRHIQQVLNRLDGNYTRTARALGIALSTLKRKLKRYGMR